MLFLSLYVWYCIYYMYFEVKTRNRNIFPDYSFFVWKHSPHYDNLLSSSKLTFGSVAKVKNHPPQKKNKDQSLIFTAVNDWAEVVALQISENQGFLFSLLCQLQQHSFRLVVQSHSHPSQLERGKEGQERACTCLWTEAVHTTALSSHCPWLGYMPCLATREAGKCGI